MDREIRYCTTADGVRIAYCVDGTTGPPILVCPGFVESFSLDDADAGQAEFIERLGSARRLIRFDMRGTGLSQRGIVDLSPSALALDLDAVVRATRIRQCYVWASTLSGPRALLWAAEHPRRVLGLMLYGTFARAADVMPATAIQAMADFVRTSPDLALNSLVGNLPADPEAARRQVEAYRKAADEEMVSTLLRAGAETDMSGFVSLVRCPVLIIHRTDDNVVPIGAGQRLASLLGNATLARLNGNVHSYSLGESAPILDAVDKFLSRAALAGATVSKKTKRNAEPVVRTVLFTDLVGHTEMMRRLGDESGRTVLRTHEQMTRNLLKRHGGTEIKTMGDGFMASFGSVTRAVDCAIALQRAFDKRNQDSEAEPLQVRVGLNAGEPIEEAGDLFGSTVILASRVAAKAGGGEILIPEPLRHLLTGKSYAYADRGDARIKGFEDAVRLYEVRWRA